MSALRSMAFPTRWSEDRGAVSIMFVVLGLAVISAVGLVVDGGRRLGALTEAQDLADNAARAAAQGVDVDAWRDTGIPSIDRNLAEAEIAELLGITESTNDVTVTITEIDESTVTVEVRMEAPRSLFWPNREVTAVETADAISGVAGP